MKAKAIGMMISLLLPEAVIAAECPREWIPAGGSLPGIGPTVYALHEWDPDGAGPQPARMIAGGTFTVASDSPATNVAMWNGLQWMPMGDGLSGFVLDLATLPDGTLIAAGLFRGLLSSHVNLAAWNGAQWTALGDSSRLINAVEVLPNGHILASHGVYPLSAGTGGPAVDGGVSRFTGAAWESLGQFNGDVRAVVSMPDGSIVAAGLFSSAGGVAAQSVARLPTGSNQWEQVGEGLESFANAAVVAVDGSLLVGGRFVTSEGRFRLARWDGAAWSLSAPAQYGETAQMVKLAGSLVAISDDFYDGYGYLREHDVLTGESRALGFTHPGRIQAIARSSRSGPGSIAVGGLFVTSGGFIPEPVITSHGVAEWTPQEPRWRRFGEATAPDGPIYALLELPNGDVLAGGDFEHAGGLSGSIAVRRFHNGEAAWSQFGGAWDAYTVDAFALGLDGTIYQGGRNGVYRWDGAWWAPLARGLNNSVNALLTLHDGRLLVGGLFNIARQNDNAQVTVNHIAIWDPATSSWSALGQGFDQSVYAVAQLPDGRIVAGGLFQNSGGVQTRRIAIWDGVAWSPLGTGMDRQVYALAVGSGPTGAPVLYAGGLFTEAGGIPASRVARWDGTRWTRLGPGVGGTVYSLLPLPSGDLLIGGRFSEVPYGQISSHIVRWTGDGPGKGIHAEPVGTSSTVRAMILRHSGNIALGGNFHSVGGTGALANDATVSIHYAERGGQNLCAADADCSGRVEAVDVFVYLNAWFAEAFHTSLETISADLDGNEVVDSTDLFLFLSSWFEENGRDCFFAP